MSINVNVLDADELEDYLELRDPKARRAIEAGNLDIAAGRTKPAEDLLLASSRTKAKTTRLKHIHDACWIRGHRHSPI